MRAGDVFVAFTDGFTEAMNADGELWGEEQLMRTLMTCHGLPSKEILARITAAADQFIGTAKQNDDMTVIVARVPGDRSRAFERTGGQSVNTGKVDFGGCGSDGTIGSWLAGPDWLSKRQH